MIEAFQREFTTEEQDHRYGRTKLVCARPNVGTVTIALEFRASRLAVDLTDEQVRQLVGWSLTVAPERELDHPYSGIFATNAATTGAILTLVRKSNVEVSFDLAITRWDPDALWQHQHRELIMSPWACRTVVGWLQSAIAPEPR
jgi:hypothetical protein